MGSDGKSKEERRRKEKRNSPSSSEDGATNKRRRTIEGEETKRQKRDKSRGKKDKHKSHKSHKHHFDKEKKSTVERHRGKHHKHSHSKLEVQELSNDDYFSKNNEFATWLKEDKDLFFSDLSSESARDLFSQFVKDWNNKKLDSRYYEGIASGPRTPHKWKIKK